MEMSALSKIWTSRRADIDEREHGLVAIEYVILGALCAALIGTAFDGATFVGTAPGGSVPVCARDAVTPTNKLKTNP